MTVEPVKKSTWSVFAGLSNSRRSNWRGISLGDCRVRGNDDPIRGLFTSSTVELVKNLEHLRARDSVAGVSRRLVRKKSLTSDSGALFLR